MLYIIWRNKVEGVEIEIVIIIITKEKGKK